MIRNLRDLSIYKNIDGKRLRKGEFIRSAALVNLTKDDIAMLNSYDELTVIDLRTNGERNEAPDEEVGHYYQVSLLEEEKIGISHEKQSDEEMANKIPNMTELYEGLITSEHSINGLKDVFSFIFNPDRNGTILWHCSEGKDRCGLVSALFLKALDYDEKTIMKDYLKSLKAARKKAYKYFFLIVIFKRNPKVAVAVKNAFLVKKEYLNAAFGAIIQKYGSFDAFFENIGVTRELRDQIKDKYLMRVR